MHSPDDSTVSQTCAPRVPSFVGLCLPWSSPQFCRVSLSIPLFFLRLNETDARKVVPKEKSDRVGIQSKERTLSLLSRNLSYLAFCPVEVLILNMTCLVA